MQTDVVRERHGSHLEGKERATYIQRIALLHAALELYEKKWKALGYAPITPPKVDEVRPVILAEGVVAELKRLQAELRIADEDLAAAERRAEQLATELERLRASVAGVGTASGPRRQTPREAVREVFDEVRKEAGLSPSREPIVPDSSRAEASAQDKSRTDAGDDDRYLPADEDPAVIHQQRIPDVATAPTTAIEAKSAETKTPPLERAVIDYLVKRGHSASAWFIAKALTDGGRAASKEDVEAALERLLRAREVRRQDLAGSIVWKI